MLRETKIQTQGTCSIPTEQMDMWRFYEFPSVPLEGAQVPTWNSHHGLRTTNKDKWNDSCDSLQSSHFDCEQ